MSRRARLRRTVALLLVLVTTTSCAASATRAAGDRGRTPPPSQSGSAPPAARQTPQPPCRDTTPQQRGEAALRSLPTSWRASGAEVVFEPGRPEVLGTTTIEGPLRVTIYVRPCAEENDALLRHVIAHELGHAWDRARMTPQLREEYRRMRRLSTTDPWIGCEGCTDFATPAGDFAETYAQWLRGSAESRSELAPPATPEQLRALAARFFQ